MEKPIVIDIGTFSTKIGLSGDTEPVEERTISVTQTTEQKESTESNTYHGHQALDLIHKTATTKPSDKPKAKTSLVVDTDIHIEHNNISDYLQHVIFSNDKLPNISKASNHRILLTDHVIQKRSHRALLSELLFETLETPSVYFEIGGVLGLYATGRLNGLVCDMGHSQTSIIPIVQGYCIEHAASKVGIGGKHLDQYFNHLLRKSGITLHTKYQLEIVRDIKETLAQCRMECAYEKLQDEEEMNCEKYKMPDGTVLQIGNARKRSPEVLFGPQLLGLQCEGIHHQIWNCINDCDLALRKPLMSHITLIGGTSLLNGFGRRLVNELVSSDYNRYSYQLLIAQNSSAKDSADKPQTSTTTATTTSVPSKPKKTNKKTGVRIYAPKNRKYSAWIGGSVFCSMLEDELWINKSQYEEFGSSILYRE